MEKKHLLSHLDELLVRSRRSLIWIVLGFGLAYTFSSHAVYWIEEPLIQRLPPGAKLIFTNPFEKFWVYLRVSMIAGVALVSPILLWEVFAFTMPALKPSEKKRILWLVMSFLLTFVLGVALGYLYVLPIILDAILKYGGDSDRVMPFLALSAYVNTAIGILLLSALFLEIPVFMIHLSAWGWIRPAVWIRSRKPAFVVNAVLSALLSPPDIASMFMMMLPLQILYEVGIVGARLFAKKVVPHSSQPS